MIDKNANIFSVKHVVLTEVARHAYSGDLEEVKEQLPFDMIPGPNANFRCCVYREREIIRQRILLAQGKSPDGKNSKGVIQVISSACEDCPIARFSVTNNCQRCMSRRCQQACRFGAISMKDDRAYIDPAKCKECGKCAQACPYNAIADLVRPCKKSCPVKAIQMDEETQLCQIDESKCISCGACVENCPFGAIEAKSSMVNVIGEIKAGKRVVAMVAPAIEGQFGADITMASLFKGIEELGFAEVVEVALGGDLTAAFEAEEWAEAYKEGKKMTTSCCPAFVNMIRKHYPSVWDNVSTTVSPMCAVSRLLKATDPEVVTVFVGPCMAKKSEAAEMNIEGNADYVLTIDEIRCMFRARDIQLEKDEMNNLQQGSVFGKRFGNAGGVTNAVVQAMQEKGEDPSKLNVMKCSGAEECKKALMLLKAGRLPADFIEGMVCSGGCVNGPGSVAFAAEAKKSRDTLIAQADDRKVWDNIQKYDLDSFSMHRSEHVQDAE